MSSMCIPSPIITIIILVFNPDWILAPIGQCGTHYVIVMLWLVNTHGKLRGGFNKKRKKKLGTSIHGWVGQDGVNFITLINCRFLMFYEL